MKWDTGTVSPYFPAIGMFLAHDYVPHSVQPLPAVVHVTTLGQVHTLSPPVHKQLQATESQVGPRNKVGYVYSREK